MIRQHVLIRVLGVAACFSLPIGCSPTVPTGDGGSGGNVPNAGPGGGSQGSGDSTDSDGDGFSDDEEINGIPGSDPFNANDTPLAPIDTDGDGCSDFDEEFFSGFCDNNPNTVSTSPPADDGAANRFDLAVVRHVDVAISDTQIDAILGEAGRILQTVQTECPDNATDVEFVRDGPSTTFSEGSDVLTAESQLDTVFAIPGDIKVVTAMIGVCGINDPNDMTIIVGCAFQGGSMVIVHNADPDVWAHEWGHVQGLGHRDDCARNVMHSFEINTNAVNEFERNAFLSPTPSVQSFGRIVVGPDAPSAVKRLLASGSSDTIVSPYQTTVTKMLSCNPLARDVSESTSDWLRRVMNQRYLAGVPKPLIEAAGAHASQALLALLDDPAMADHRANVARGLGFCSDPSACNPLIDTVLATGGRLTDDQFATLVESMLALGRIAAYDDSGVALQFLVDGIDPATWANLSVQWTYANMSEQDAAELMARLSVMALHISDHPDASDYLQVAQDWLFNEPNPYDALRQQLDEALSTQPSAKQGRTVHRYR